MQGFVFSDTVKDYNRIVDGISDQSQDRRDERIVDRIAENRVESDNHQYVMHNAGNRRHAVFPGLEPEDNIDQHAD